MKIVVIGGSGRIGEKLVRNLRQEDCRVFEASRSTGVDIVTGAGLERALEEAEIVIDVSNAPSFESDDARRFFEMSGRNLIAAGRAAGVRHHIVLSIVGLDGLHGGYFRAKKIQEALVEGSGIPFTIVRSTQFFDLIADVVQSGTAAEVRIPPVLAQPIAGEEVADALADAAFSDPFNAMVEIAGPERFRLDEIATVIATAHEDGRRIVPDLHARYFGAEIADGALLPRPGVRLVKRRFEDWLRDSLQPARVRVRA